MVKADWGVKRNCPKCSAKFYDLKKNPAECPSCHFSFDPEAVVKKKPKRKSRTSEEAKPAKPAPKKKAAGDEDGDIDLPDFDGMEVMEEMDDLDEEEVLDEVEAIPTKSSKNDDDANEEDFLEDGDIEIEDEEDDDK